MFKKTQAVRNALLTACFCYLFLSFLSLHLQSPPPQQPFFPLKCFTAYTMPTVTATRIIKTIITFSIDCTELFFVCRFFIASAVATAVTTARTLLCIRATYTFFASFFCSDEVYYNGNGNDSNNRNNNKIFHNSSLRHLF